MKGRLINIFRRVNPEDSSRPYIVDIEIMGNIIHQPTSESDLLNLVNHVIAKLGVVELDIQLK